MSRKRALANTIFSSVHQHGIVHRLDQALEQLLAILQACAAPIQIVEQLIDRSAELRERLGLIRDPDAARRKVGAAPRACNCLRNQATAVPAGASSATARPRPRLRWLEVRSKRARGDKLNDDLVCDSYDALCSAPFW